MSGTIEIVEAPLSPVALAARYRSLCDDPRFGSLPGKIELDVWGRITMSPATNLHGVVQARLIQRLTSLDGVAIAEASVMTSIGVIVADVAWIASGSRIAGAVMTPFPQAPDLCIEIVSPSNSRKELIEKVAAYLEAGAQEVWLVYPKNKQIQFHGAAGMLQVSRFAISVQDLFEF